MNILALTAAWLSGLGVPVTAPQVVVMPPNPDVIAYVETGVLHTTTGTLSDWLHGADGDSLLHELAHVAAWQAGRRIATRDDAAIEEGAAEAMARDLGWPWAVRYGGGIQMIGESAYVPQTEWVRGLSAMGCRCPVDSRAARRWRWRFVTGDRQAMTAEAMQVPTEGVEGADD